MDVAAPLRAGSENDRVRSTLAGFPSAVSVAMLPGGQPLNIFVEILGGTVVALVASLAFYQGPRAFWRWRDLLARILA